MTNVSIVIPAYNEEKYIGRLLVSLQKLQQEEILEIIVVDNGSTDGTRAVVNRFVPAFGKLRLVEEPKKGVAFARSRAIEESRGDIIAFLDADTYIHNGWFPKMLELFASPRVVCASGPTYFDDVSLILRIFGAIYWFVVAVIVAPTVGSVGIFANLSARAASLKEIGGIDTSIEFYGDDANITRRLAKVGKVIFTQRFYVYASGRRFNKLGLIGTSWRYIINFFSSVIVHKPITKGYTEVR